jgi:signal transduction histidine kinase
MKRKLSGLSRRYVAALRTHLKQGRRADLLPAVGLGHRAVVLGVETLAMARIHERALAALDIAADKLAQLRRAEVFFAEAITPIVDTHRAARQSRSDLSRVNATLDRRTAELAASNHQLQRGILRRKNVETALKKSGEHYTKLLKDSLQLPDGLRHLTHKILLAQEKERQTLSQQLQNEIAQTLLGIQVRLLSLKTAAKGSPATLAKEIAGTQRLVEESVQAINRFARELDIHQDA